MSWAMPHLTSCMRTTAVLCAVALGATLATGARADATDEVSLVAFGQEAQTATLVVESSHFVYLPVIGSWLDVGRVGPEASLVLDGICQDVVGLFLLSRVLERLGALAAVWRIAPWFPSSGGGGISVRATF